MPNRTNTYLHLITKAIQLYAHKMRIYFFDEVFSGHFI